MKTILFLIPFVFISCTKDYWDNFDWGFHGKQKKENMTEDELHFFEIYGILPPTYYEQIIDTLIIDEPEHDSIPGGSGGGGNSNDLHY